MADRIPNNSWQVTVAWTFELLAKRQSDPSGTRPYGLLGEFDCDLEVAYWDDAGCGFDWEVTAITVSNGDDGKPLYVTPESDPDLWTVLARTLKGNKSLDASILESIEVREAA